jgi:putative transposase
MNLFGSIEDGIMVESSVGMLVNNELLRLQKRFPGVEIDEFAIMPNHLHGAIYITDTDRKQTIGTIVGSFKSSTSRLINALQKTKGVPIWQRNFYEHIIRDEEDLNRIRVYIANNPANWNVDDEKNSP